jgi:CheY-like chemotaxis protein
VLLDLQLPRWSGEEILKRLRSTERSAQTPVVVMTSSYANQHREHAQRQAAVHYFRKPSELQDFLELGRIVGDILRDRKALRTEA